MKTSHGVSKNGKTVSKKTTNKKNGIEVYWCVSVVNNEKEEMNGRKTDSLGK